MIKLYLTFLSGELTDPPWELISEYRKQKLLTQRNALSRRQSLCAELLLRHAMKSCGIEPETPLVIEKGENGKPALRGKACCFNLSHSQDAVFCAISDMEIGADVQLIRMAQTSLVDRYFCRDEREYILASPEQNTAFTEIWAAKESYCKASGLGLSCPLSSFSVLDSKIAARLWHKQIDNYQLAVYCEGEIPSDLQIQTVDQDALF